MQKRETSSVPDSLDWEEWKPHEHPFWHHAIAGSSAGIMEHLAIYPLDTIKTRMQAYKSLFGTRSIQNAAQSVINEHGVRGLMRGVSAIAIGCIPAHIGLFTVYESSKRFLKVEDKNVTYQPFRAALCGAASTLTHDVILTPTDVVKQRLQLGCYTGVRNCISHVVRTEGLVAFYRSLPTTVMMNLPFGTILVTANETFRKILKIDSETLQEEQKTTLINGGHIDKSNVLLWYYASAGMAAAVATLVTHPLDTIKTRIQTQDCATSFRRVGGNVGYQKIIPKYAGLTSVVKQMHAEEGLRGFWRGLTPRIILGCPGAAICWGTYETVKHFLLHSKYHKIFKTT